MSSGIFPFPQSLEMHIGKPIHYVSGPFAGRTIRSELSEYQKPDLGRKFAKRDRRPVDPPPVVRLRMMETKDEGTPNEREEELHADSIDISGWVAHVDLFAVDLPEETRPAQMLKDIGSSSNSPLGISSGDQAVDQTSIQGSQWTGTHMIDVGEEANLTTSVFGSSFVHAVQVLDMSGELVILFVFADLSVRVEGHFVYRYRCFDLLGRVDGSDDIPIAAELFSGIFVIYSTKEFPGLQASTSLTKHLGRWGVRVNLRETSRRRKNKKEDEDEDGEGSSGAGDTTVDDDHEAQFYTQQFLAPFGIQSTGPSQLSPVAFGAPLSYQSHAGQYSQVQDVSLSSGRNPGPE